MVRDITTMSPIARFERESNEMMFTIILIFILVASVKIAFWLWTRHKERLLNEAEAAEIEAAEAEDSEKKASKAEAMALLEKNNRILADNRAVLKEIQAAQKLEKLGRNNEDLKKSLKEAEEEKKELLKRLEKLEKSLGV